MLKVLQDGDIPIRSVCGGEGTCGSCQVRVAYSEAEEQLTEELACQLSVDDDMWVTVLPESRISEHQILLSRAEADEATLSREGPLKEEVSVDPLLQRESLSLTPPSLTDNTSDLDRVCRELIRETEAKQVTATLDVVKTIAPVLRRCDWNPQVSWMDLPDGPSEIIEVEGPTDDACYGLALDIGTTTVVAELVDLSNGREVASAGEYNRQGQFGEDVISRINYSASRDDGPATLQRAVIETVNELLAELISRTDTDPDSIRLVVCSGNTTMIHTLCGLDPNNIRKDPYIPTVSSPPPFSARQLGLDVHQSARVLAFPAVGSFVGGDVVAGVLASGLHEREELTLYVDIGTNGEIVLGNSEFLMTCSASAGPAFEGGGIRHGMRAMDGAIERIQVSPDDLEVYCQTVGDVPPIGLCGTGLIDTLATLQQTGVINRSGRFSDDMQHPRLRESEEGLEFVLVWEKQAGIGDDIVITSGDIKHLMRSKAAIYAAIRMLLQNVGMEESIIQRVLIAGGFGNYLDLESAVAIGLFPDLPRDRFRFVGNGALLGAVEGVVSGQSWHEATGLASKMTYLELSAESQAGEFMDEFVAAQFIPHTDLSLFPSVEAEGEGVQLTSSEETEENGDTNE